MTAIVDYVVAVADTGGGTQDIDSPRFANIDPVGAIIIGSQSDAVDTLHDDYVVSAGMVAAQGGTPVEWCANIFHQDNVTTGHTRRDQDNAAVLKLLDPADTSDPVTVLAEATFTNFHNDSGGGGIRITWTTTPFAAYRFYVILFGGTDCECDVQRWAEGSVNVDDTATAPDFAFSDDEPAQFVIAFGTTGNEDTTSPSAHARLCIGMANNGSGGIEQGYFAMIGSDGFGEDRSAAVISDARYFCNHGTAGGTGVNLFSTSEVTSFTAGTDSNQVQITRRNANGSLTYGLFACTFKDTVNVHVGWDAHPSGTGDNDHTGPGFPPQFVWSILTAFTTVDLDERADSNDDASSYGHGFFTPSIENSFTYNADDDATTMDTSVRDRAQAMLRENFNTEEIAATHVAMISTGYRLNYSTAEATQFLALSIQAPAFPEMETNHPVPDVLDIVSY